jgi:hypothetical protein
MDIAIVADQGTHLLIKQDGRFAIIERRNNRLYNCHDGKRDGIPLDNIAGIDAILNPDDWTGEAAAQAQFDEIVARGTQLGQTML